MLKKYQAHINLEWCNTSNVIKYLFKYVTKWVAKATILIEKGTTNNSDAQDTKRVVKQMNEIQEYLDCRYLQVKLSSVLLLSKSTKENPQFRNWLYIYKDNN